MNFGLSKSAGLVPDGEIQKGGKLVGCDDAIWNFWIL